MFGTPWLRLCKPETLLGCRCWLLELTHLGEHRGLGCHGPCPDLLSRGFRRQCIVKKCCSLASIAQVFRVTTDRHEHADVEQVDSGHTSRMSAHRFLGIIITRPGYQHGERGMSERISPPLVLKVGVSLLCWGTSRVSPCKEQVERLTTNVGSHRGLSSGERLSRPKEKP